MRLKPKVENTYTFKDLFPIFEKKGKKKKHWFKYPSYDTLQPKKDNIYIFKGLYLSLMREKK